MKALQITPAPQHFRLHLSDDATLEDVKAMLNAIGFLYMPGHAPGVDRLVEQYPHLVHPGDRVRLANYQRALSAGTN